MSHRGRVAVRRYGCPRHVVISHKPSFIPERFLVIKSYRFCPSPLAATVPHHVPPFHPSRDLIASLLKQYRLLHFTQQCFSDVALTFLIWLFIECHTRTDPKRRKSGSKWKVEERRAFQLLWEITKEPICRLCQTLAAGLGGLYWRACRREVCRTWWERSVLGFIKNT